MEKAMKKASTPLTQYNHNSNNIPLTTTSTTTNRGMSWSYEKDIVEMKWNEIMQFNNVRSWIFLAKNFGFHNEKIL